MVVISLSQVVINFWESKCLVSKSKSVRVEMPTAALLLCDFIRIVLLIQDSFLEVQKFILWERTLKQNTRIRNFLGFKTCRKNNIFRIVYNTEKIQTFFSIFWEDSVTLFSLDLFCCSMQMLSFLSRRNPKSSEFRVLSNVPEST